MGFPHIDLKPLERGMDALVRMAEALEGLLALGNRALDLLEKEQG